MKQAIRNIKNLNQGNQLRQGDLTPLVYELDDYNQLVDEKARIRLYRGTTIFFETTARVDEKNRVEFIVRHPLEVGEYTLEITVNDYKYPSHEFETLNIVPSTDAYVMSKIKDYGIQRIADYIIDRLPKNDALDGWKKTLDEGGALQYDEEEQKFWSLITTYSQDLSRKIFTTKDIEELSKTHAFGMLIDDTVFEIEIIKIDFSSIGDSKVLYDIKDRNRFEEYIKSTYYIPENYTLKDSFESVYMHYDFVVKPK